MTRPVFALAVAVAAITVLSACKPAAPAVDVAKETDALKAGEAQWQLDIKSKDPARFAAHYAAGATMMDPGGPPAQGPAAVQAGMAEAYKDPNFSLSFAADKVGVSAAGDMGYTQGHFTETETDPKTHAVATQTGFYVTVYQKQPDGSWKAVEDIASPGAPAAAAATPAKS
jgi:ketosteroid isomerase-like protein